MPSAHESGECMNWICSSDGASRGLQGQRGRATSHPLIWMVIVAAVMAAVWWYPSARDAWLAQSAKSSGPGAGGPGGSPWRFGGGGGRAQPVSVGEVQLRDVRLTISALGTLTALNTAVVRAKVDGELKAIRFTEGQQVTAGALLAEIDARSTEVMLQQAEGQLQRDQAQLRNAQLDRYLSAHRALASGAMMLLVRAVVACFWYGAQTAAASGAMVALMVRSPDILAFHQNSHFLGHSTLEVICYVVIWALQLLIIQKGMETVRKFQDWAGPAVWVAMLALAVGLAIKAGGFSFEHGIPQDVLIEKAEIV